MDRVVKACLVLIVLLLSAIVLHPTIIPEPVHAAPQIPHLSDETGSRVNAPQSDHSARYRFYKHLTFGASYPGINDALNEEAKLGWDVVAVTTFGQYNNQVLVILGQ